MPPFRVGIIGCGGRGRQHALGYQASSEAHIVACADPFEESRSQLAADFAVETPYADYREMLEHENLDIVSVCTWPDFHEEMMVAAAQSGAQAIHAEKPMAPTWGASKNIIQVCQEHGAIITFCHQRRFGPQFIKARDLARDGHIGPLRRVEGSCPNLFDWGTHWFDMFFFFNNDEPAAWVLGQIDVARDHKVFGVPLDTGGLSWIRWHNGLEGLLTTGDTGLHDNRLMLRLVGDEGVIEVRPGAKEGPPVRLQRQSGAWESPALTPTDPDHNDTVLATLDLIASLKTGREPELSGRRALQATELIFATYESSRRRGRVELPLLEDDSALLTMLQEGVVGP
ncbi:MAG: gfo/Idh/MocA family oxidoreductase [Candidatus Latescibacteria bacterium]|nr:gfo/Idh/MocA family oxidoreductase [Candidatus Latescibacterota bacterium]